MSGGGARSRPEGRPSAHLTASLGNDPVSSAAAAAAEGYDGWARDRTADGGHALAGKWPRRLMGAFLALALNPIDTRALATRALATAPESAGINDMQGKATPGLGALGEAAVEEGTEHAGEVVEGAEETIGEAVEGAGETIGEAAEHVGEAAKGAIKGAVEGGATAAEEGTTAAEEAGQKTAEEAQEQAAREFIERFNASADKALDSVDANKVNHIMENAEHPLGHNWETIFGGQKPTWEQLKPVLKEVMRQEGSEEVFDEGKHVYTRCMEYNGREVFVKFQKDDAGFVTRVSTAYMSFQNAGDV